MKYCSSKTHKGILNEKEILLTLKLHTLLHTQHYSQTSLLLLYFLTLDLLLQVTIYRKQKILTSKKRQCINYLPKSKENGTPKVNNGRTHSYIELHLRIAHMGNM